MCCYQWVRRGRKVTPDNPDARSPITAFKECDRRKPPRHRPLDVSRYCWSLIIVVRLHGSIHSKVPPADGKKVVVLPLQQQIQCRASGFVQSQFTLVLAVSSIRGPACVIVMSKSPHTASILCGFTRR
jgi:hypothetical protein